jgi:hypothetical protein
VVKKQIIQNVWDNWKISTDETAFEMTISHGEKWCMNGLRPNKEIILV